MGIFSVFSTKYSIPRGQTAKDYAKELLDKGRWHADQINKSTTVFDFIYSYQKLTSILDELIWLNEKKKVSMYPTPKSNLNSIKSNMQATINDFMDRVVSSIHSSGEKWANEVDYFLDSIMTSKDFCDLMTFENKSKLEKLKNRSKNIRENILNAKKEDTINLIWIKENLDFSNYNPMEVIVAMEKNISKIYTDYLYSAKPAKFGPELYSLLKRNVLSSKLPLAAEVRLESILAEYEDKFSTYNPLIVMDNMDGHQFEIFCANILRKIGFIDVEVTPGSRDQGVDIIAKKDDIRYAIQCKCYSSDLGNKPVQEVNTGKAIYKCQVGVVMTNRHFTQGAKDAADATGILLWDREKLISMIELANFALE